MNFVPIIVPPPPSHRARELSCKIQETVEEYRRYDPALSSTDVQQALRLAATQTSDGTRVAAVIVALLGALALLGGLFLWRGGGETTPTTTMIALVGIIVLGLVVVMIKARGS